MFLFDSSLLYFRLYISNRLLQMTVLYFIKMNYKLSFIFCVFGCDCIEYDALSIERKRKGFEDDKTNFRGMFSTKYL